MLILCLRKNTKEKASEKVYILLNNIIIIRLLKANNDNLYYKYK